MWLLFLPGLALAGDPSLMTLGQTPGTCDDLAASSAATAFHITMVASDIVAALLVISAVLESEGRSAPAPSVPATAGVDAESPDSPDDADPAEPVVAVDDFRADPDPVSSSAHTDLLARARAQAATPADPAADVGERDDPDVADTDAESLLREMLHAEVIDDE